MCLRVFSVALWFSPSFSRADAIDDLVRNAMAKEHIPGVAVGVIRSGKLVLARGYGKADLEADEAVTPETEFLLASMSKQFCAESILMLAAEGKLSLDDPISKYVDGTPEGWKVITLRQLLGHQSGIHDIIDVPGYDFYNQWSKEAVLAKLAPLPLDFTPGDRFKYSNSGYYLLGWTVERVSGMPLAEFARKRIFEPAGMSHTRYFRYQEIMPRRAHAYAWKEDHFINEWPERPAAADGSGAVVSDLEDWAKYDAALDAGFPVSKAIQAQMAAHGTLNGGKPSPYGLGWYDDGEGRVHHTGGSYGFSTVFLRDPVQHVTVVILRNAKGGPVLEMARLVLRAFDEQRSKGSSLRVERKTPRAATGICVAAWKPRGERKAPRWHER